MLICSRPPASPVFVTQMLSVVCFSIATFLAMLLRLQAQPHIVAAISAADQTCVVEIDPYVLGYLVYNVTETDRHTDRQVLPLNPCN